MEQARSSPSTNRKAEEIVLHERAKLVLRAETIFPGLHEFNCEIFRVGATIGEHTVVEVGGQMDKLWSLGVEKNPLAVSIKSWELKTIPPVCVALPETIKDGLGASAMISPSRVYQMIQMGRVGPGQFGDKTVNYHFALEKERGVLVISWWTEENALHLGVTPLPRESLGNFGLFVLDGDRVHSA